MQMFFNCSHCGKESDKRAGEVNRAVRNGLNLYCSRECSGLGRRSGKSVEQRKADKRAYDIEYRKRDPEGRKLTDYEIRQEKGTLSKNQKRRREYERSIRNNPETGAVGNLELGERGMKGRWVIYWDVSSMGGRQLCRGPSCVSSVTENLIHFTRDTSYPRRIDKKYLIADFADKEHATQSLKLAHEAFHAEWNSRKRTYEDLRDALNRAQQERRDAAEKAALSVL